MAKMDVVEAIEKLRLLNRGADFNLIVNQNNYDSIYVDNPESLVLSDGALGDLFEWVDDTHKAIKTKGDDGVEIKVKNVSDFPPTSIQLKVAGPNATMISKINELVNKMFVASDAKDPDKNYRDVDDKGHSIEEKDEDRYTALMEFHTILAEKKVFEGASKNDVMEFRMKINGRDGKTIYPIFVNKKDIHVILKYINILKTFSDEFELPNEFYQMILNGDSYSMKDIKGTSDKVPEPKLASETAGEYEDRLKASYGKEPEMSSTGIRKPWAHESIDYSPTVKASTSIMSDNPTISGDDVSSLSDDSGYTSAYYTHMGSVKNKKKNTFTFVDDGVGKPVKSRADEKTTSKIKSALKGFLSFLGQHKVAAIGITALVVGAGVVIATGGAGAMLATLAKIVIYTARAFVVPIPKVLMGIPLTPEDAIIMIMEIIALIYGAVKLHKKLKSKRDKGKDKRTPEEEVEDLDVSTEEAMAIIHENEGKLISIKAVLDNPYSTDEAKEKAKADYAEASRTIEAAKKIINANKKRRGQLVPEDIPAEELGFTDAESLEGGIRL